MRTDGAALVAVIRSPITEPESRGRSSPACLHDPDPEPWAERDDSEISSAIAAGDAKAEAELFVRFRPRVRRKVEASLPGRPDCEDLTNEILQGAITSLRRRGFRGECQLATFIHAVARNKIAEYLRRRRPQTTELTEDLNLRDPGLTAEETLIREEVAHAVRETVARLKPKYRNVLFLYYYEGLSVAEVSKAMNVPARRISEWKDYGLRQIRSRFGLRLSELR